MAKEKFATKIDSEVLKELREYSDESKLPISEVVTRAVAEHLRLVRIRPAFRAAMDSVLNKHDALLKSLANK